MADADMKYVNSLLLKDEAGVLQGWLDRQMSAPGFRSDRINERELNDQSRRFLGQFRSASSENTDIGSPAWAGARALLEDLSRSRAEQGFSPSETATFVFSLKEPLFERIQREFATDSAKLATAMWSLT